MKTKTIPFDLETAKKIQAGEIEGKIKTKDGQDVSIVLWNKKDEDGYVMLAIIDKPGTDFVASYTLNGEITKGYEEVLDLVLEVPDKPQFKPFDKVLVRDYNDEEWTCALFSHYSYTTAPHIYACVGNLFVNQCIPYESNQELVGTTNKPKEE